MLTPKSGSRISQPVFFQTPSPVKRSLFSKSLPTPMQLKLASPRKKTRFFARENLLASEEENLKDECVDTDELPFKTYAKRRDSGCHEISDTNVTMSSPRTSSALNFHSCSSGDENNEDVYFSSPGFRSPTKNFKSRAGVSASPGSSSGISCTSPARSPPETPPHTRKLRALTLFDTPHTPKTLMSKLRSNMTQKIDAIAASPLTSQKKPMQYHDTEMSEDVFSLNKAKHDEDYNSVIHKSNVHLPTPRLHSLKSSALVNINPFTPDNRTSGKRTRTHKQG